LIVERRSEEGKMDVTRGPLGDEVGPRKTVLLREPRVGLEAIVVVDNIACGPAIGGVRMAPDVTLEEVGRLARAMTFKNAAAGLAHGGGKAGIIADPSCPAARKEALVRAFARMITELTEYIPGPDMGTDETCMAWVRDEIGRAVGLPRVVGGIPLDEIGATGFGLAVAAEVAAWSRPIRFVGGVGGPAHVLTVAAVARCAGVKRLVFAHIGRRTLRALAQGARAPFGSFGAEGQVFFLTHR
jgi:hypothetical protein